MKNFILVIVAVVLFVLLCPVGLVVELVMIWRRENRKHLNDFFLRIAVSIDQLGNTICATLFNLALIKHSSPFRFGNPDETISSVIGKNKINHSLTSVGVWLDWVLDSLDDNHSLKNIESDE